MASVDQPFTNFHTPENSEFYARNLYRALDTEKADFRFLEILPGDKDDVVKCKLIQSSTGLKYEALSYCAGDPKDTRGILVDGHPFNVFASLFGALVALRGLSESRTVWIDQICINQNDVRERNYQVGLMKNVYQNAERVVAWHGPIGDGRSGIAAVHDLYDAYVQLEGSIQRKSPSHRAFGFDEKFALCHDIADVYAMKLALVDDDVIIDKLKALSHLFTAELWVRVWVWQELILARSILFLWDSGSIDSEPLFTAAMIFLELQTTPKTLYSKTQVRYILQTPDKPSNLFYLFLILDWRKSPGAYGFKEFLRYSRNAKSSDPRDKVYALCGLISSDYILTPNYTDTVGSVYCRTVESIMLAEQSLDVLAYCQHTDSQSSNSLPTWCPDWSVPLHKSYTQKITILAHASHPRACGALTGEIKMLHEHGERGACLYELHFPGLRIDRVEELGDLPSDVIISGDKVFNDLLELWLPIIGKKRPASEDLMADLHRTLMGCRGESMIDYGSLHDKLMDTDMAHEAVEGNRRFFVTENGHMGMGPPHVCPGDFVCVLPRTIAPFLLREKGKFYTLVGEAYISDGYMEGRAYDEMQNGEISLVQFILR